MKRLLVLVAACAPTVVANLKPANWIADTSTFHPSGGGGASLADRYRDAATKIVTFAHADRGAYTKLSHLTDRIGNRLSGSASLDKAIAWAAQAMKDDGFEVHTEKVMVPRWVRGAEDAAITGPISRDLHIIGLGGSIGTPKGGITAPVVVVHDWADLDAKQDAIKGAIVLYDVPMPAYSEDKGAGYGDVVPYRGAGAVQASKRGAVAVLMRSVTAHSLRTPHTGAMNYDDAVPKIPAAAVTVEDSTLLARLASQGTVTVHLHMEDTKLDDVESANVIGELRGKDAPDEVVVIGGHIDSWDVGQGAHDDGAGVVTMMQTLAVLKKLGLQPRRTIRVVLFTNEENGLRGGKGYAKDHEAEAGKTVFALESDSGGFAPRGFTIQSKDPDGQRRASERVRTIITLLRTLGVGRVIEGHSGADVSPMIANNVVTGELVTDGRKYFDIHHTEADTLDKVDPQELADCVAAVAVVAFVVADMPGRLDDP
jgi:carboxypeptidase Q